MAASREARIWTFNFVAVSVSTFAFFLGSFMIFPALPLYVKAIGGSASEVGLVIGITNAAALLLRPLMGRLVDTRGRRTTLTLGALLTTIAAMAYSVATVVPGLMAIRVLYGAAISGFSTAGPAYVGDIAPPRRRGEAFAYWGMFQSISIAVGAPLGFFILDSGALRGLDLRVSGWFPGGRDVSSGGNFTLLFFAIAAVGVVSVVFTRLLREVHRPVTGSKVSLWAMVGRLLDRRAVFPAVVNGLGQVSFIGLFAFVPIFAREHGVGNPGFFVTAYAIAVLVSRFVTGTLSDRFGRMAAIIPGLALMGAPLISLIWFQGTWHLIVAAAVFGWGHGLSQPALQAYTLDRLSREQAGMGMSTFAGGQDIGVILGGVVLGYVLEATSYGVLFLSMGLACVASLGILLVGTAWTGELFRWRGKVG